jgi:hypothetical protein
MIMKNTDSLPPEYQENNPEIEAQWAVRALNHAETYLKILQSVPGSTVQLTRSVDYLRMS